MLNACSQNMAERALQALIKEALWVRILHVAVNERRAQQSHSAPACSVKPKGESDCVDSGEVRWHTFHAVCEIHGHHV